MRGKAGIGGVVVLAALVAAASGAAIVHGSGSSVAAKVHRHHDWTIAVHPRFDATNAKDAAGQPVAVAGKVPRSTIPAGSNGTFVIGPCPKHYTAVNGAAGAKVHSQSIVLVQRGEGRQGRRKWFVDMGNAYPGPIKVKLFLACHR